MDINQWILQVEQAYELANRKLSTRTKDFLLGEIQPQYTQLQNKIISEVYDTIVSFFYKKVSRGETFGDIKRAEKYGFDFTFTLEEYYDIDNGPFLNMAKTYWTFRVELEDLFPGSRYQASGDTEDLFAKHHNCVLSVILREIELEIAGVFFPSLSSEIPLPSLSSRRKMQRSLLKTHIPEMDVKLFLSQSPEMRREKKFILIRIVNAVKKKKEKKTVIKELAKKRIPSDILNIDALTYFQLLSLPEWTIVTMVETYRTMKYIMNVPHELVFEEMEIRRNSQDNSISGGSLSKDEIASISKENLTTNFTEGNPLTLSNYIAYTLYREYLNTPLPSAALREEATKKAKKIFI